MADDAQDRNLPASERKIQKARADGQVARSRDLGHLAAVGAGVALLIAFAPTFTAWLSLLLTDGLRFDATALARPGAMTERLSHSTCQMLLAVVPLGAVVALVAVVASVLSGGWNFTLKPLEPKFEQVRSHQRHRPAVLEAAAGRDAEGLPAGAGAGCHRRHVPEGAAAGTSPSSSRCRCRRRWPRPARCCRAACC